MKKQKYVEWDNSHPPLMQPQLYSKSVSVGWQGGAEHLHCGFVNIRNTCYINACIQALFHCPSFLSWVDSDVDLHVCGNKPQCVTCGVLGVRQDMKGHPHGVITPNTVLSRLKCINNNMDVLHQEDVHEFLVSLLDRMSFDFLSNYVQSNLNFCLSQTTPVGIIFGGWMTTVATCTACLKTSTTYSPFQDISVAMKTVDSVQDAVDCFFKKEEIDYKCSSCKDGKFAVQSYSIHKMPNTLIIQLKRFDNNFKKIHKGINISPTLTVNCDPKKKTYSLVSGILHAGEDLDSGHYTAFGVCPSQEICLFDDCKVIMQKTEESLLSDVWQNNCYILFYEMIPNNVYPSTHQHRKAFEDVANITPCLGKVFDPSKAKFSVSILKRVADSTPRLDCAVTPTNVRQEENDELQGSSLILDRPLVLTPPNKGPYPGSAHVQRGHSGCLEKVKSPSGEWRVSHVTSTFKEDSVSRKLFTVECDSKAVQPLKIRRSRKLIPKTSASQSSYNYSVVQDQRVSPIRVHKTRKTEPKTSSSQSSYNYSVQQQKRVSPIKVCKTKRLLPKTSVSQSSNEYSILPHAEAGCNVSSELPDQASKDVTMDMSAAVLTDIPQMEESEEDMDILPPSLSQCSGHAVTDPLVNEVEGISKDMCSSSHSMEGPQLFTGVTLGENDVPGAKLLKPEVAQNNIKTLRRWLECRGLPQKGVKDELVSKVKACISMGRANILDVKVDGGTWYEKKRKAMGMTSRMPCLPSEGWDTFPSTPIPLMFNFGHIYHYLVESFPKPAVASNNESVESGDSDSEVTGFDDGSLTDLETTAMKSHKPFRRGMLFVKSDFLRNIKDMKHDKFYSVKAECRASYELRKYVVSCTISQASGSIYSCSCQCRQQTLGRCSHVGALLIYVWIHVKLHGHQVSCLAAVRMYYIQGCYSNSFYRLNPDFRNG